MAFLPFSVFMSQMTDRFAAIEAQMDRAHPGVFGGRTDVARRIALEGLDLDHVRT